MKSFLPSKNILLAFLILIAALFLMPLKPFYPNSNLDPSWVYGIGYAFEKGMQFGVDVIFTYGPLGSIMYPTIIGIPVGISNLTWIVVVILTFLNVRNFIKAEKGILYAVCIYLIVLCLYPSRDSAIFLYYISLWSFSKNIQQYKFVLALNIILIAMFPLIKFTYAFLSLTFLPLFFTCGRSKGLIITLCTILSYLGLWLLADQNLKNILDYNIFGFEISKGYNSAMAVWGNQIELVIGIIFGLGFFVIFYKSQESNNISKNFTFNMNFLFKSYGFIYILFVTFVAFKQGFVRHDEHAISFFMYIAAGLPLIVNFLKPEFFRIGISISVASILVLIFSIFSHTKVYPHNLIINSFNRVYTNLTQPEIKNKDINNAIKINNILSSNGSSDIATVAISDVIANDLDWRPRPIFQSYSSYTDKLTRKNAEFIKSKSNQDIFLKLQAIDQHLITQEDPLYWLALIDNYYFNDVYHLKPNKNKNSNLQFIDSIEAFPDANGWIKIDVSNLTTISVMSSLSLLSHLKSFVLKPSDILLQIKFSNGDTKLHKFINGNVSPFIVSPYVANEFDFANISCPSLINNPVSSIRLVNNNGFPVKYSGNITLNTYKYIGVESSFCKINKVYGSSNLLNDPDNLNASKFVKIDNRRALNAHAPSIYSLKTSKSVRKVCGGIRSEANNNPNFQPMEFKITNESGIEIFSRMVMQGDGFKEECINLSPDTSYRLVTRKLGTGAYNWAYWVLKINE